MLSLCRRHDNSMGMLVRFLLYSYSLDLSGRKLVEAHSTLGLHSLGGGNLSGSPTLPEIEGPFEVQIKVRFNDNSTDRYHALFEYSTPSTSHDDSVWFGQYTGPTNPDTVFLDIRVNAARYICFSSSAAPIVQEQDYEYKFGVDSANVARIYRDGSLLRTCTGIPPPLNVTREHHLGKGPLTDAFSVSDPLNGAITGLRVTNIGAMAHPRDALVFRNIPSQTFGSGFVASFYARFNNHPTNSTLYGWQRIFDFGNGEQDNNILCGQYNMENDMVCEVYDGTSRYDVRAVGSLIADEFAFWHFSALRTGGTLWDFTIEKNGVEVANAQHTFSFNSGIFRRLLKFGTSNWAAGQHSDLNGVVLGFRMDRAVVS